MRIWPKLKTDPVLSSKVVHRKCLPLSRDTNLFLHSFILHPSFSSPQEEVGGRKLTWSVHQYHKDGMVIPIKTPGQGRSDVIGSRNMWKASSLGKPQLLLLLRLLAVALAYLFFRSSSPPTLVKPEKDKRKLSTHSLLMLGVCCCCVFKNL